MTGEEWREDVEDDSTDDVEGHDAHEATVLPQRPILFLSEDTELDGDDV